MNEDIIIKSERLYLKKVSEKDLLDVCTQGNDKDIAMYVGSNFPSPYTKEDAAKYIKEANDNWKKMEKFSFAIFLKDSDIYIGAIGLKKNKFDIYHIGYWIGKEFWGNGYTTEAVKILIKYLFDNNIARKIQTGVDSPNIASVKVLQNNSFEIEGTLKDEVYLKDGRIVDKFLFGLINKKFKK